MNEIDSNDAAQQLAAVQKEVAALRASDQRRELGVELGIGGKALDAVNELVSKGLSSREAHAIASSRDPALFNAPPAGGFQPGVHGSMRPSLGTSPPAPATIRERSAAIAQLQRENPMAGQAAVYRLHGELLREVFVKSHAPGWA
jgi:hypothetical protein